MRRIAWGAAVVSACVLGCSQLHGDPWKLGEAAQNADDPDAGWVFNNVDPPDAAYPYGPSSPPPFQPVFGPTVTLSNAPPPIFGGTLAVTRDGNTAVAADPDRDSVYIVDIPSRTVTHTVFVGQSSLPFRVAEDGAHRAHVTLRGTGDLVTIDLATGAFTTRHVCAEPRGVAYESSTDRVHVACDGGQFVSLPAAGGDPVRTLNLGRGLRDVVVVSGGALAVSLFKPAKVVRVEADGTVSAPFGPNPTSASLPDVAWRTVAAPSGLMMVHQIATTLSTDLVASSAVAYYTGSVVSSAETPLPDNATTPVPPKSTRTLLGVVLPVDGAVSPDGSSMLFVSAAGSRNALLTGYCFQSKTEYCKGFTGSGGGGGGGAPPVPPPSNDYHGPTQQSVTSEPLSPQYVAAAFIDGQHALLQAREPAQLTFVDVAYPHKETGVVVLSTQSREDTGHSVFHANSGGFVACASCHAEGGEDGHVWKVGQGSNPLGPRRTPSLRGTVAGTAPYHWDGKLANEDVLIDDVYTAKMTGPHLDSPQKGALEKWIEAIPPPNAEPVTDAASVQRGLALFGGQAECTNCHSGPKLTNNVSADVGTGGVFQPPPLVGVSARAPFLHDGCASSLTDRFVNACAGGDFHGRVKSLSSGDVQDLVAYLNTL